MLGYVYLPTRSRLFVWYIFVKAMGGVVDYSSGIRRAGLGKMIFIARMLAISYHMIRWLGI